MHPSFLFLDIDGVMNTTASCIQNRSGLVFTGAAVEALQMIVRETGCRIVISSTRRGAGLIALKNSFRVNGMTDIARRISGSTPRFTESDDDDWREDEIDAWLAEHGVSGRYAILDDKPLTGPLRYRLVLTDPDQGLIPEMAPRVISLLR